MNSTFQYCWRGKAGGRILSLVRERQVWVTQRAEVHDRRGCTANGNCLSGTGMVTKVYESGSQRRVHLYAETRMKVRDKEWVPTGGVGGELSV